MLKFIARRLRDHVTKRTPDLFIGGKEQPYLIRWYVFRHRRFASCYLHRILRSDDDRALHDHPWANVSFVFGGRYIEHTPKGSFERRAGSLTFRKATAAHRLEILPGECAWTLFLTGPVVREWGVHCPQGWRKWTKFVNMEDTGRVGPGCGD